MKQRSVKGRGDRFGLQMGPQEEQLGQAPTPQGALAGEINPPVEAPSPEGQVGHLPACFWTTRKHTVKGISHAGREEVVIHELMSVFWLALWCHCPLQQRFKLPIGSYQ